MTLVTTSRRSTPAIRAIAKDLAFATGARYLSRGKHGLREISSEHDLFVVLEQLRSEILMTFYRDGEPCLVRIIKKHETGVREGILTKGIRTSDRELGNILDDGTCQVQYCESANGLILAFDGPQRRCMRLVLERGIY
ncbi:MAG TPA: hypothetical protein PK024_04860 [Methanospirillum sp.]|uniref:hypothetical protein n=1 Tax=Methanospirillum sp. TaxID=45200 RepID=UPI002BB51E28|nr:hypothetical protein [Methanospirillum sp.]HOJ96155.1 hypothetical protein [Methanospirillum sp.]